MTGGTEMIISPEGSQMSRFPQGYIPSNRVKRQIDLANFRQLSDAISFQPEGVTLQQQQQIQQQLQAQVQNTHYWSGCPDNVDTARSYVAQFLGFDEKRLLMYGYHPRTSSSMSYTSSSSYSQDSNEPQSGSTSYSTPFKNPSQNDDDSAPFGFYSPPSTSLPYLKRQVRSAENKEEENEEQELKRASRRVGRKRKDPSKMKLVNQHNYMAGAWVGSI